MNHPSPQFAHPTAHRRRWPAVAAVALLLFAALAALLAHHGWAPYGFERDANDWSAAHRPPAARAVAVVVTSLGNAVVPYLLALAAGAVAVRALPVPRPSRRAVLLFFAPVLWLIAGQLVRLGLMQVFARPRPPRMNWATDASGFSFPSGHSFTSAVCAGLLALAIARARPGAARAAVVGAVVFAVAVGLSRIYLGVHWPLDVLGGWLLAVGWLALGTAVAPLSGRPGS
ncbi:phosphatase PAP2 family protein [Streptomyces sp. CBMA123]|uniref:phosphatase PAP2 family protein n=1 Tax=Streptomyces sp. CBMA123 TaxID=1896313 RepID=UPI001661CCAB|nr:phosphatase PAP2 family protein [Streptomyces sp. CBMA123]